MDIISLMTSRLRARFDGKVLIPEEPVDLPTGQVVELRIEIKREPTAGVQRASLAELVKWIQALPPLGPDAEMPPPDGAKNYRHYLYGHEKAE